jgi:SLT domain-containing protein
VDHAGPAGPGQAQKLATVADLRIIIHYESGGDPNAVNNSDSNAAGGTPSMGLMQTIQPTFDEYKLPGHDSIFDPVSNIIAGIRYANSRYGGLDQVPGVIAIKNGQPYVGY